jgi:hypothetical protein
VGARQGQRQCQEVKGVVPSSTSLSLCVAL